MIQFVNTIKIEAPIDRVFDFLADPTHLPKWNYYIIEVKLISKQGAQQGSRYHQIRKTDEQFFTITACIPPQRIEFTADEDATLRLKRTIEFSIADTGTQLKDTFELSHSNPFMDLVMPLAKGRLRKAVFANLLKLQELLEEGSTTLQDGRNVILGSNFSNPSPR